VALTLLIQHTMLMHRAMFSSVACLALPYISALFHKRCDFRRWGWVLNIKCLFNFLYNMYLKHFSLRELNKILS